MNNKLLMKNKYFAPVVLFLYSIIIRLLCSYNAPFYGDESIYSDNAIFYMIGRALLQGKVLYKEIFDHKPPYIYFLNALCAMFPWHHIGLFVVDVAVTFVIMLFTYKICNLLTQNNIIRILAITFTGFVLNFDQISNGMCRTETISIALLLPCIYTFYKFFIDVLNNKLEGKLFFKVTDMYIIGLLSGITFMFTLKSPVILLPFAFATAFVLIKNKKYINLSLVFVSGLVGVSIAVLPAVIYVVSNNCINDAIKDLVDVNIAYAPSDSRIGANKEMILGALANWKIKYTPFFVFLFYSIVLMIVSKYNKYIKFSTTVSFVIVFLYTFMSNRPNPYYLQMFTPYVTIFVILFCEGVIKLTKNTKVSKSFPKYAFTAFCIVFTISLNIICGTTRILRNVKYFGYYMSDIKNAIEEEFKDKKDIKDLKILTLGSSSEVYVYLNTKYNFKYQLIPYIKYEKYTEPFDEQEKYILNAEPDVVVFHKDLFLKQFTLDKYNTFLINLMMNYTPFSQVRTVDEEPYILFKKEIGNIKNNK